MKTARERLAFRIAEKLTEDYNIRSRDDGQWLEPEDFYRDILSLLPQSYEELSVELEKFAESISGEPKPIERPTLLDKLRAAIHATEGMSLRCVLEAAISQCIQLNMIRDNCDHEFEDCSSTTRPNLEFCLICGRIQATSDATSIRSTAD